MHPWSEITRRCWSRGRSIIHVAIIDFLEWALAEPAFSLSVPFNYSRALFLPIPRARARTPSRPLTQFAIDVFLAAVRVTSSDFNVRALGRLAAFVRLCGDLASAPHQSTSARSIALSPTSPFSELAIDAKVRTLLSVTRCGFRCIFGFAMRTAAFR